VKLYDVPGYDAPLRLSEDHAAILGGVEHTTPLLAPARNAAKGAWIDYAVALGADPTLAELSTKSDLIEIYGD